MKKQRIAICGNCVKPETFGELLNSCEESELAAFWDGCNNEESVRIAKDLGCELVEDYDDLLKNYSLDGVVIVTENAQHKDLIIKAAESGVSIFVEKPLCLSLADALEIQKAVKENNVKFFMSDPFVRRGILKVQELIQDGTLGEITGARFRLARSNAVHGRVNYDKEMTQGGIMANVGGHMLHKAHFLFGKPESLCSNLAYYTEEGKANGIEENAVIVMRYPKDVLVTLECSWVNGGQSNRDEIYGTKGTAVIFPYGEEKNGERVTLTVGRDAPVNFSGDQLPPVPTRHIRYFIEMLAKDLPNDIVGKVPESNSGVSIDNAVEYTEILETIYQSANKGFVNLRRN